MIKYIDENNFEFKLFGRQYTMHNGQLDIDEVMYEDEAGGNETYELVRAYALVALGQFKHEDLMEGKLK